MTNRSIINNARPPNLKQGNKGAVRTRRFDNPGEILSSPVSEDENPPALSINTTTVELHRVGIFKSQVLRLESVEITHVTGSGTEITICDTDSGGNPTSQTITVITADDLETTLVTAWNNALQDNNGDILAPVDDGGVFGVQYVFDADVTKRMGLLGVGQVEGDLEVRIPGTNRVIGGAGPLEVVVGVSTGGLIGGTPIP